MFRSFPRATAVALASDAARSGGAPIPITFETGVGMGFDPAAEVEHATRLAGIPGMAGVVGHGGSREALMTAPIYNEARIPQIVPTGTCLPRSTTV